MMKRKSFVFITFWITVLAMGATAKSSLVFEGTRTPAEAKRQAAELVKQMTLDEKLDMIHGEGFNMAAVARLGIPPLNMSGSSMGLTQQPWPAIKGLDPATAFPSTQLLAATWNRERSYEYAKAIAEEFRARQMQVLLGPGINMYRFPLCGRNYEYMGEDPYLAAEMVVPYVKGSQDQRVLVTVNTVVSERALREIYFPAFKASVQQGDALGFMNSYNLLNGVYTGENRWLLEDVLRKEWGFRGMVVSDWNSIWNSDLASNSGVDIEMPGGRQGFVLAKETMKRFLTEGSLTEKEIDEKIMNLLVPCLELGLFDSNWADPSLKKLDEHNQIALRTATEGMTLLKNESSLLPLEPSTVRKIVVIGSAAEETATTGGGSGAVLPFSDRVVSIWQGMQNNYGDQVVLLKEFDESVVKDADAVVVCIGLNTGWKIRDHREKKLAGATIISEQEAYIQRTGGGAEGEGHDRATYSLYPRDDKLVAQCAAVNPNTVVLVSAGGGVDLTPWIDQVSSVLWMYYGGQVAGQAAADLVCGKVNPSGKLPFTLGRMLEDSGVAQDAGLSWNKKENGPVKMAGCREYQDVEYSEGIFVGYRHYDADGIAPLYCFGHGLGYAPFKYGTLSIKKTGWAQFTVSFTLSNVGNRDGFEVAQLYVADSESSVPRPPQELKGFKKVFLKAGESKTVEIELDESAFSFWHPETKKWTVEPGEFILRIGSSSRDIRAQKAITIK